MQATTDNYSPPAIHVWGEGKDQKAKEQVVLKVMGKRLGVDFYSYKQYRHYLSNILNKVNDNND